MRQIVGSIEGEYRRYKTLADQAIGQLTDEQLVLAGSSGGNSVATLVWHVSGNLVSRFTEFLTSDGEKPWRDRDTEFLTRQVGRTELSQKWEHAWAVLFRTIADLDDELLELGGEYPRREFFGPRGLTSLARAYVLPCRPDRVPGQGPPRRDLAVLEYSAR